MSLIRYVTRVHFADRVIEDALGEELLRLGVARPLVIADRDARADALDRLSDSLPRGAAPTVLVLPGAPNEDGRSGLLARGEFDGVIGIGGEIALRASRRLAARDPELPLLAAPTTCACIGLEPPCELAATSTAALAAIPAAILCDPTLMLGEEAGATAERGFDALMHCVEAYLGAAWNPPADGIALEGARRAAAHLEAAVADASDLGARRELMAAGLNAALAAQKGLGGLEALARATERETGLERRHGRLHAALLPQIMTFNAPAVGERLADLAEALRLPPREDPAAALAALGVRLGLPPTLAETPLGANALRRAAAAAAAHPATRTNPRRITEEDYRGFLARSG